MKRSEDGWITDQVTSGQQVVGGDETVGKREAVLLQYHYNYKKLS